MSYELQMAYNIDVVKTNVPEALEVLLDAVANPAFHNWELQEQIKRLTKDIENAKNNPQSLLMEVSSFGSCRSRTVIVWFRQCIPKTLRVQLQPGDDSVLHVPLGLPLSVLCAPQSTALSLCWSSSKSVSKVFWFMAISSMAIPMFSNCIWGKVPQWWSGQVPASCNIEDDCNSCVWRRIHQSK